MRVQCPNCGGDHPKWDCKRPAKKSEHSGNGMALDQAGRESVPRKKSTASLKEVKLFVGDTAQVAPDKVGKPDRKIAGQAYNTQAGTQALPVDTNSSIVENEGLILSTSKTDVADTSAGTVLDKDRQPKFDKVAYQRNYMRTYRAKKKEAGK